MLFLLLVTFLSGILVCLVVCIYLVFWWYGTNSTNARPWLNQYGEFSTPNEILELKSKLTEDGSYVGLNLVCQFLFQELKDTKTIRKWAIQKLRKEFLELINSNTGKLLDNIQIRSIDLGKRLPVINNVSVLNNNESSKIKDNTSNNNEQSFKTSETKSNNPKEQKSKNISEVTLLLNLTYDGDFQLSVDVDTVFGKSAYLSVKILKLTGNLRLQFTNVPFRHWSFAFVEEPMIEFEVDSQFEGRSIAKLSSIITNQIRKSICRKHTLPNYKMRYKPFFHACQGVVHSQGVLYADRPLEEGRCEVILTGCTNLTACCKDSFLYCSLTLDSVLWQKMKAYRQKHWAVYECEFASTQLFGLTFKDKFSAERQESVVAITEVSVGSYAHNLSILQNDILTSINGVRLASYKHATKLIRSSKQKVILRLERFVNNEIRHSHSSLKTQHSMQFLDSKSDGTKDGGLDRDSNEGVEEGRTGGGGVDEMRHQRASSSGRLSEMKKVAHTCKDDTDDKSHGAVSELRLSGSSVLSKTIKYSQNPIFNQKFDFDITPKTNFLNVCVWLEGPDRTSKGMPADKRVLLGHVSIPMSDIALECSLTLQGDVVKALNINPCEARNAAGHASYSEYSHLSGFEDKLCHGNILLKFNYFGESKTFNEDEREKSLDGVEGVTDLKEDVSKERPSSKQALGTHNVHFFHSVQFQSAVYCEFCFKKIWFKSAFMCKYCKMICHKKCVHKCQLETTCTHKTSLKDKKEAPRIHPSSQINLSTARKNDGSGEERHEIAAKLLGKQLFRGLALEERKEHLDRVISATQREIESESVKNMELQEVEKSCSNAKTKTLLKEKIENSDGKLKSLKLLMLQYCAGRQCCIEVDVLKNTEANDGSNESRKIQKVIFKVDEENCVEFDEKYREEDEFDDNFKENDEFDETYRENDEFDEEEEEEEAEEKIEQRSMEIKRLIGKVESELNYEDDYYEIEDSSILNDEVVHNDTELEKLEIGSNIVGKSKSIELKTQLNRSISFQSIFKDIKPKEKFTSLFNNFNY